jgi:hypothetical protein
MKNRHRARFAKGGWTGIWSRSLEEAASAGVAEWSDGVRGDVVSRRPPFQPS